MISNGIIPVSTWIFTSISFVVTLILFLLIYYFALKNFKKRIGHPFTKKFWDLIKSLFQRKVSDELGSLVFRRWGFLLLTGTLAIFIAHISHHYIFNYSLKEQAFQHNEYVKQKYITLLDKLLVLKNDINFSALQNVDEVGQDLVLNGQYFTSVDSTISAIKNSFYLTDNGVEKFRTMKKYKNDYYKADIEIKGKLRSYGDPITSQSIIKNTLILNDVNLMNEWNQGVDKLYTQLFNAIDELNKNNPDNSYFLSLQQERFAMESNIYTILEQTSKLITVTNAGHFLGKGIYWTIYSVFGIVLFFMFWQYLKTELFVREKISHLKDPSKKLSLDNYRKLVLDYANGSETIISNGLYILITMGIIGTFLGLALAFYSASQSFPPTGISASVADDNIKAMAVSGLIQTIYNYSYAILTSLLAYTLSIILRVGWRLSFNNPLATFASLLNTITWHESRNLQDQVHELQKKMDDKIMEGIRKKVSEIFKAVSHSL